MKRRTETSPDGRVRHYLNDLLHSFGDDPAVIHASGTKEYYREGKRHRIVGPAVIHANGDLEYWVDGQLSKYGEPAIDYDHRKEYWVHGLLDRRGGPAVITPDVIRYYRMGKLHRLDGPAVIYTSGRKEYYCDGELHRLDGPAISDSNNKEYHEYGKLHKLHSPAIIKPIIDENSVSKRQRYCYKYYVNGLKHRDNGPAVIYEGEYVKYYRYGELHRDRREGPATYYYKTHEYVYYENGVKVDELSDLPV